ncbi:MAG: enolase C-terminal domain-like protein [Planctomycetota bacterium]
MANPADITIREATNSTRNFVYRQPMKFGGRVVEDVCVLRTEVMVTRQGSKKKVKGIGEMTMGNAWAWPSKIPGKITLKLMLEIANRAVAKAQEAELSGDPFQINRRIQEIRDAVTHEMQIEYKIAEPIPELAAMVATSPLDAAVHDAFGRCCSANSFHCLTSDFLNEDLSAYLGEDFIGKYPSDYLAPEPKSTMPLYHLVGALDPLSEGELRERLNDDYPETLEEWLHRDGISHLKIKLAGNNIDWDVGRIVEVTRICEAVASDRNWKLSFDFNEQCPNEDYVLDLLERIERLSKPSFDRLQYIEQPTPRDLTQRTEMTVHRIARIRPVVIDESLTGPQSLKLARQRGYTGLALKACKGQSESLIMGAAGSEYKMFTCVQDLTCVGGSFLHSAALASRFPSVAAIEGNGRQYCPIGNAAYMKQYAPMFRVRYGTVPTELLDSNGLGFDWKPLGTDEEE